MLSCLRRIYRVFGLQAFLKTLLLLIGLIGMAVVGFVCLGRFNAAGAAVSGLAVGAPLSRPITAHNALFSKAVPVGLSTYAVVILRGNRFARDNGVKHRIIAIATVVVFDV